MRFLSGNRRPSSGGAAASLRPSTSTSKPKPKPQGKPRRRPPLSPTLFAAALAASLLFFLAILLRYGVPSSLSPPSPSRPKPQLRRLPAMRRPALPLPLAAAVDVTTKNLYGRIEFHDVDGGALKQGWEVRYAGGEWDSEKLKVFVVPHSYNDPGWKRTVEEYYQQQ